MSDRRIEIIRTPQGEYKVQMVGYDGPPIRVAHNASGIKRTAAQRKADRQAMQAALKTVYERQRSGSS